MTLMAAHRSGAPQRPEPLPTPTPTALDAAQWLPRWERLVRYRQALLDAGEGTNARDCGRLYAVSWASLWLAQWLDAPAPTRAASLVFDEEALSDVVEVAFEMNCRDADPAQAAELLDWAEGAMEEPLGIILRRVETYVRFGQLHCCERLIARLDGDSTRPDVAALARAVRDWCAGMPAPHLPFERILATSADFGVRAAARSLAADLRRGGR
jgi:hypothetical protein